MCTSSGTTFSLTLAAALWLTTPVAWAQTPTNPEPVATTATPAATVTPPEAATAGPPSSPTAPANDKRIGTVKQVRGESWLGQTDARRPAASGEGVFETERVSTGQRGGATITLKDGTVLTMGPNSTMDLSKFQYNATTQEGNFAMNLLQGSVRVVTGLLAKINPDLFKISTPTSVVGVRGTDFIVETEAAR
ncbi:MAG: FecR family protein [Hydrogenophaga sp.]|uniref:FecR family protein n=1 Tax=Hydrogenophaga sp. TaxID=1904254 RepID=UPI0027462DFC|nr:FecR family protein [Hydrogenophaga sp.]MDP2418765.1 FecR family protein [Hydrogenophaga sp.]MDZ4188051.1 FecR family protein [Hydrogenophaga sp.]